MVTKRRECVFYQDSQNYKTIESMSSFSVSQTKKRKMDVTWLFPFVSRKCYQFIFFSTQWRTPNTIAISFSYKLFLFLFLNMNVNMNFEQGGGPKFWHVSARVGLHQGRPAPETCCMLWVLTEVYWSGPGPVAWLPAELLCLILKKKTHEKIHFF